jgi:hypothetical protein
VGALVSAVSTASRYLSSWSTIRNQVGLGQAGGLEHPQACGLGQTAPHQGCFPYPRIALDGYQPRLARLHPGDYLRHPGAFCRPADENVERCPPVLHAPTHFARAVGIFLTRRA